ncbi:hypothetical protein EGI20_18930, partial [Aquitalea sp. S1-19]|nr:hypothetical protein [Aquitalea sp. S1-19]
DTTAPIISVEVVNDRNNDGWLNKEEVGDGTARVQVTVDDASLRAGGQVTLTIDRGGNPESRMVTVKIVNGEVQFSNAQGQALTGGSYTYTYDAINKKGVINFNEGILADGGKLKVDAVQTDAAGNKGDASDSAQLDVAAPAPTVELQGAGTDDTYSKGEIGSDNSVTAK